MSSGLKFKLKLGEKTIQLPNPTRAAPDHKAPQETTKNNNNNHPNSALEQPKHAESATALPSSPPRRNIVRLRLPPPKLEKFLWCQCEEEFCQKWRKISTAIFLPPNHQVQLGALVNRAKGKKSVDFPILFQLPASPLTSVWPVTQEQFISQPFYCYLNPDPSKASCTIPEDLMYKNENVIEWNQEEQENQNQMNE